MKELLMRTRCKRCGSSNTYSWIDETVVCRSCGYTNKKDEKENKK